MKLSVYNREGQETGRTVELADEVFNIEPNQHVMWLDVKHYLAAQRQGTHSAKEKGDVDLTTKKLKKQKGTGGARAGSMKSGVFTGGGRIHGPRPRDYSFKLNKKVKALARQSAMALKAKAGSITVLEGVNFEKPSTKQFITMLNGLQLSEKKTLFLLPEVNKNFYLSSRNLRKARVLPVDSVNTYELIHTDQIVLAEGAIEGLTKLLVRE